MCVDWFPPCRGDLVTKGTNPGKTSWLGTLGHPVNSLHHHLVPLPICLGCQATPRSGYWTPSLWSVLLTGFQPPKVDLSYHSSLGSPFPFKQ